MRRAIAPCRLPCIDNHVERNPYLCAVTVEGPRAIDTVGPARRACDRLRPHRARDEARTTGLHWQRTDRVRAIEGCIAAPDALHRRDLLVHALPTSRERCADGSIVVLTAA